ncbi:hypothetical protein BO83DRAFT_69579 [Aspergillus eucalypticola CBS 122712]|uniref:Uncharacterized protein n=1 Tax=Aspergillus eucalypticola (strain CBS 122712 / IBT 29274) TaxID=1448314 RepID=A0A317VBK1_ASPEC|nr:uncharacterized protein BO83DRAFT_69579 [Aspergillus eucalypticola CBS 122712]PWY69300.1 hypothetical protein BO83DRAFT_69579 [Aspergillus eucalypticola CBS 122712]
MQLPVPPKWPAWISKLLDLIASSPVGIWILLTWRLGVSSTVSHLKSSTPPTCVIKEFIQQPRHIGSIGITNYQIHINRTHN